MCSGVPAYQTLLGLLLWFEFFRTIALLLGALRRSSEFNRHNSLPGGVAGHAEDRHDI